ncbi:MAG: pantoate--beta-alanine ligase [Chlorobiaceae bacterium]|nr:pantoate--beta-alanine ligase [Chlorobiaceae bacterium]
MQIITDPLHMQAIAEKLRLNRQLIGVVMTMGALHEGHLSLINEARKIAGTIILTIFVNPKQFAPHEDFHRYPRPFEQDAAHAKAAGVDYVFAPPVEAVYSENFQTTVHPGPLGEQFEGKQRPGHFSGVATIVTKLLQITRPHIAVFGEKDAQQLAVIKRLVKDLNIDVQIIEAPIIRDENGLAISSRNIYLSAKERDAATVLYKGLCHAERRIAEPCLDLDTIVPEVETIIKSSLSCRPEYICFVDDETFQPASKAEKGKTYRLLLAVQTGTVRLIDNRKFMV